MADPGREYRSPAGNFRLACYPPRTDNALQAWNAADNLLIEELCQLQAPAAETLVVNDEHGALSVALLPRALWTDSMLSFLALRDNEQRNQRPATPVTWSTAAPEPVPRFTALRIPGQLAYMEYQLRCLAARMAPGSLLLAAGMDKHLSPHTAAMLERQIGPTRRHRGRNKARLFTATCDERHAASDAARASYYCEAAGGELQALDNVFSRDRLDHGARTLLGELYRLEPGHRLLDLACGNGVLGIAAARAGLAAELVFADESAMAIESARLNVQARLPDAFSRCAFHHGDGLLAYAGESADLILCNPPFHNRQAVDEFVGRRLLQQCADHLPPGGRLCLVANRHLGYTALLKRRFDRLEVMHAGPKFTVWLARRR